MSLIQWGNFTLHSGQPSWWRIDCDSLSDSELEICARLIREGAGQYHGVLWPKSHPGSAAPRLGEMLLRDIERHLPRHNSQVAVLIVDDVLTTGSSMEEVKAEVLKKDPEYIIKGAVIFSRKPDYPSWINPIFVVNGVR